MWGWLKYPCLNIDLEKTVLISSVFMWVLIFPFWIYTVNVQKETCMRIFYISLHDTHSHVHEWSPQSDGIVGNYYITTLKK